MAIETRFFLFVIMAFHTVWRQVSLESRRVIIIIWPRSRFELCDGIFIVVLYYLLLLLEGK